MNTFVWLYDENGILFALNYTHIETVASRGDYAEIRMVSGQVVYVQNTVEQVMQMVPA